MNKRWIALALGFFLGNALAQEPKLAQVPLFVATRIDPNIMLLIDNSGSMDNIIWADGFDSTHIYPGWGYDPAAGNYLLRYIDRYHHGSYTCGNHGRWVRGRRSGTTKYLCLPDPVGRGYTRYTGNYLNYLFNTYANNADLTRGAIPKDYRMKAARDVATDLVQHTPGVRFGLTHFNFSEGGRIRAACGSSVTTLVNRIQDLTSSTWTPLAETLYEITRYFRGMRGFFNRTRYTSPIQYRCQKNFTIAITDGYPTYDTHFPGNDPDDQADTNHALPDWDGKHPETHRSQYPNFPQYSDGFQPEGDARYEGYTLYLDDLAKFAWDIDLRKGGTDNAGESFDDPDFKQQNMFTYTVGFAVANQMLQDAAEYGHGLYYTAENANELKHVLLQALQDIAGKSAASASTVANTVYATVGGKVYLGRFNSGDWSGQFLAFELDNDPKSSTFGRLKKTGPGPDGSLWDGGKKIPPADNRVILSYDPETRQGIPFRWDNLNDAQKGLLGNEDILNYLRGDRSKEQQNGGSFRDRSTLLGDIIHASPAYVGKPDAGYTDESYKAFVQAKRHRTSVIYTSANDGMLHGFHGDTGDELLAYVPNALFRDNIDDDDAPQLKQLTDPNYQHRYYVDGPPTAMDAYLKGQWRTVLIDALGAGGRALFALDVTDPGNFREDNAYQLVLWEIDEHTPGYGELGHILKSLPLVRQPDGKWVVIAGNGYHSAHGKAVLYIIDAEDGSPLQTIEVDAGPLNGLSAPQVADVDDDFIADYIYAGDLKGNLWKFIWDRDQNQWKVAYQEGNTPLPLFKATDGQGHAQPITAVPQVSIIPGKGGRLILFGTGKYFDEEDNTVDIPTQTFYGIWDNDWPPEERPTRDDLQVQTIDRDLSSSNKRVTTANEVDWAAFNADTGKWEGQKGWLFDLEQGERVVEDALILKERIIFTTLIPGNASDPCKPQAEGWLMELRSSTGKRPAVPIFDINEDRKFNSDDLIQGVPPSGLKPKEGSPTQPSIIAIPPGKEKPFIAKFSSTAGGTIIQMANPLDIRLESWRKLEK